MTEHIYEFTILDAHDVTGRVWTYSCPGVSFEDAHRMFEMDMKGPPCPFDIPKSTLLLQVNCVSTYGHDRPRFGVTFYMKRFAGKGEFYTPAWGRKEAA